MLMGQVTSSPTRSSLETLEQMGFPRDVASNALEMTSNNFDQALQLLVDQKTAEERNRRSAAIDRRGISVIKKPIESSPSSSSNKTLLPTSSSQKRLEELSMTFADRYQVVDTLSYILKTLHDNPTEAKYRTIKTTNARFIETLGADPKMQYKVEEFLNILGFERAGEWLTISPQFNRTLLKRGLEALENVKLTSEVYQSSKRHAEFEQVMEQSRVTANEEELERRRKFASKLPVIPEIGAAGTTRISITISEGAPSLNRRFVADDTLLDVVHFIGSERSLVGQKILEGAWILVDDTLLQRRTFTVNDFSKTLHALELWPSATLRVRVRV